MISRKISKDIRIFFRQVFFLFLFTNDDRFSWQLGIFSINDEELAYDGSKGSEKKI